MKEAGIIAISDDGQPVANSNLFRLAMQYADHFGLFIMSHSEDKNLVGDGVMNEGLCLHQARPAGTTRAAEEVMIARDILVAGGGGQADSPVPCLHAGRRAACARGGAASA